MLKTTGDVLKQARKAKGLTQQEVADLVGVSRNSYMKWESNQVDSIKSNMLYVLSVLLEIPLPELLGTRPVEGEATGTIDEYIVEHRPIINNDDLIKASKAIHPLGYLYEIAFTRLNMQLDEKLETYFGMSRFNVLGIIAGKIDSIKVFEAVKFCTLTRLNLADFISLGTINGRSNTRVVYDGVGNCFTFLNLAEAHDGFVKHEAEAYALAGYGKDMHTLVRLTNDFDKTKMAKMLDYAFELSKEE